MDGTAAWMTRDPGEDLHRQRASGRNNSSTTEDQEDFYTDGARRSSSSSEKQRTDKLRGQDNQDDIYTDGVVRGDLLRRRRSGAEVFNIHRYQVVSFLVISNSPRCNIALFQSGVGSVCMCLNTGSSVLANSGRRPRTKGIRKVVCSGSAAGSTTSTAEYQGIIFVCRGSAAGSATSTGDDQGRIFVCRDQRQDQPRRRKTI